jgi:hypothetical protein
MNDLQRSVKLQQQPTPSRLSSTQTIRKIVVYLLAALIAAATIVWIGFLGWGIVTTLQWLLDCIKNFLATYF